MGIVFCLVIFHKLFLFYGSNVIKFLAKETDPLPLLPAGKLFTTLSSHSCI